jgi:hypothetical protein
MGPPCIPLDYPTHTDSLLVKLMLRSTFILIVSASITAGFASADLIAWSAPQDITSSAEVRTNGTLVTARNPWAQVFAAPTVNGVSFASFTPPGWGGGGWSLMNGSTTGDGEYDALLDSCRVVSFGSASNPSEWGAVRLDILGALTQGNVYEIQVWYTDQRLGTTTNTLNDRTMAMSSVAGAAVINSGAITNLGSLIQGPTSIALEADPNNTAGAGDTVFGQYVIGTFTRTSSDPLYLLVQGIHPIATQGQRAHLGAFQIRELDGSTAGIPFCDPANNNSTGASAVLTGTRGTGIGSDLHLDVTSGVPGQLAYMLVGNEATSGIIVSDGLFCLVGTPTAQFFRYNKAGTDMDSIGGFDPAGMMINASGTSTTGFGFDVPSTIPDTVPIAILAGDTWHFQCWYRDTPSGAGSSNFTNGLSVTF